MKYLGLILTMVVGCGGGSGNATDASIVGGNDGAHDGPVDAPADAPPDAGPPGGSPPTGMCRDGWCWVLPRPQGEPLRAIAGVSASDVWALGDADTLLHYDGTSWTRSVAAGVTWNGATNLLAFAQNDVWAAVDLELLHWNGTSWSAPTTTIGRPSLLGGTVSNDVLVWDSTNANIQAWDGSSWTSRPLPAPGWHPIKFGGDAVATLAVSNTGAIAKWLGSAWGIIDAGSHPANAALIVDSTHVVVAQDGGVSFWDGTNWTAHNPPTAVGFTAITGRAFDDVWVSGPMGRFHWDGMSWTAAAPAADDTGVITSLWEDPSGAPWAAYSDAEVRRLSAGSWVPLTSQGDVVLGYGTAENDIMTISSRGVSSHWDGTAWTATALPAGYVLRDLWGSGPNNYWLAAGKSDGPVADCVAIHWDGTTWTPSAPLETLPDSDGLGDHTCLVAAWGSAAGDVYVASHTHLFHYDGTTWTGPNGIVGGSLLTDIFGSSSNDVTVVGGSTLYHWDGTTWAQKTAPKVLSTGWENSPTDIWFDSFWYDGTAFVTIDGVQGTGVPVGASDDMFSFTFDNGVVMHHWTGNGASTPTASHRFFVAKGGWRASSGRVYAVADVGLLVH